MTTVDRRAETKTVRIERNTAFGVETAWRAALREAFPVAIEAPWTGREKGQAKRLASGWAHARQITFIDFTDWAVRNWTAIMRKQFKWMTKSPPPTVPAFAFFAAVTDQFAECWAEGKLTAWLSAKERTRIEQLQGRGMTYEQAVAEAGRQDAVSTLRDEMKQREIKVRARDRGATAKLEQAKKLVELEGRAPVHPRSRAALEALAKARQSAEPRPIAGVPDKEFVPLVAPMVVSERNPFD